MYMYLVSAVRVLYIKAFVIFKYRLIQCLHKYLIGPKSICCVVCYIFDRVAFVGAKSGENPWAEP